MVFIIGMVIYNFRYNKKYSNFYKIKYGEILNDWYFEVGENEFVVLFLFF